MNSLPIRFWRKVRFGHGPSACWRWVGSESGEGYGQMWMNGRNVGAHRIMYEAASGPIPGGFQIDHLCRNTACVNPAHLEAVTGRENTLRGDTLPARNAAKTHCVNGHPFAGGNLWTDSKGHRRCRECRRAANRRYLARMNGGSDGI